MRVDLACKHLELHLLLLIGKLLLVEQRLVHQRILLFDVLDHHFKIGKHLRKLVVTADDFLKIIVLVARLMHHITKRRNTFCEIGCKEMNQNPRHHNCEQNNDQTSLYNTRYIIIGLVINRTDINLRV